MPENVPLPIRRDAASPFSPDPELARLRETDPVSTSQSLLPTGDLVDVRLVIGYGAAREALACPHLSSRPDAKLRQLIGEQAGFLVAMDPPDHTRVRRLLTGEFTVRRINAFRPRFVELVDEALDRMEQAGGPVDLMTAFALPLPSLVICELLGVPYEDRADFQRHSDTMLDLSLTMEEQFANAMEMHTYMGDLVAAQRENPGADILGMLVREHGDELSDDDLIGIGNLLLIAGHETTANMLALGTLLLLRHPDQLALVREDPEVVNGAIEEMLRYLSIVNNGAIRTAIEEFALAGQVIHEGERVAVSLPSANRDPALMAEPDTFDVTRRPSAHVAFGHGIHQCLGQQLARMELRLALPALLRRFPTLRLAVPHEELRYRELAPVNGVLSLPVTW
ncbi:cytochrome P450 [Nonomuraea sp. SBT364]|uniref:cytochrome P450 n=1 Tax=Nonomuraea sp. SBT364 TaxID=1580530 RepID=UPI00066DE189|nr:cytochrome P450 [Nonomuraea sp. SBT364]